MGVSKERNARECPAQEAGLFFVWTKVNVIYSRFIGYSRGITTTQGI